jgi:topoisomerase-4 subunit B
MYAGSNGQAAVTHIIFEYVNNSIDEYLAGFGKKITLSINTESNSILLRDYGRGIPFGSLDSVFFEMHSSGKYKTLNEENPYGASGGVNGVGATLGSVTGTAMVTSYRAGKSKTNAYTVEGKDVPIESTTKEKDGTSIYWKPDADAFTNHIIDVESIRTKLEDLSYLTPGLEFELIVDGGKPEVFVSKGLRQFVEDYTVEKDRITPIFTFGGSTPLVRIEGALVWTKKTGFDRMYTNLIHNAEGGTHLTALKTTVTREFNKFFNTTFSGEEIRRGLCVIMSISVPGEIQFTGQNKEKLNMPELNAPISGILKDEIKNIFSSAPKEFETIVKLLTKINSAADVDKIMKTITASAKKKSSSLFDVSPKYKGCSSETNIELFLAEGLSAAGGLTLTRNAVNQAIYALKGKPLNSFSKELAEVLQNEEIQELIRILGDAKDAQKRFDKIILAADADYDGSQIVNLLLGFFAQFYPNLIKSGKVYIPVLPKYMASSQKGEIKFAMDDEEKKKIPSSWDISFLKGLGEMFPAQLAKFTTDTKTRKLLQIKVDENEWGEFYEALKLALGKEKEDMQGRREMFV